MEPSSFGKAKQLFRSGEYEKALGVFNTVLADDPGNSDAHNYKALALESLGRYEEALESYNRALEISPDDANALISKGDFLVEKLQRYAEAIPLFDKVIALEPSYRLDAYVFRGFAFHCLNMHERARASFFKAIEQEIREGDARAFYHKARALSFLDRKQEAIETLRKAIAFDVRYLRAEDARQELAFKNLRDEPEFIELVGLGKKDSNRS